MKLPNWIKTIFSKKFEDNYQLYLLIDTEILMQDWLISFLIPLVERMINAVSPQIRQMLSDSLIKLWEEAEKTENPWDNIVIGLLMSLIGISTPNKG